MSRFGSPAVAVIGSADPHFIPERLDRLPPTTEVIVIEDGNHSLETTEAIGRTVTASR